MDSPAALQLSKQFCVSEHGSFRILLLQESEVVLLYGTLLLFVVHLMYRIYSILWFPFFPVFSSSFFFPACSAFVMDSCSLFTSL